MANLDFIAEGNWKLDLDGENVSGLLSNERVITRKITGIPIKEIPALVATLYQRTSVLNPDDGNKYYSVKNPRVNGEIQEGTWRGVSVRAVEGVHNAGRTTSPAGTITQVLALNWATEIHEEEARLVEAPTMQPMGAACGN